MFTGSSSVSRALAALALASLLGACAPLPVADPQAAFEARSARFAALQDWRLVARIGVATDDDGGSATLHWRQARAAYEIDLFGPFGRGLLRIHGTDTAAVLETPAGETLYAGSAERLFQEHLGWRVPVAPLRRWLLGLVDPGDDYRLDGRGRLASVTRDGWQVDFEAYRQQQAYELPSRLSLRTEGLRIRLAVHEWQLAP